ncbi:ABC-2 family transporter protein [bacterium BMS3Abin06]|nr:ABC-2 family transporter protein [bacterium BMS3Abin06]HDZ01834.1 ABC transporter [Nitrospirota bacterium]
MNKIFIIAKKELATNFKSPVAYIILILTISIFNIFFFMIIDENREVSLRDVFRVMEFMFVFLAPLLTMKTFSEEKLSGTMEFLMTTPTTNTAIVLGKYLGSLIFFTLLIIMTTVYYLIIEYFGRPDRLATLSGYTGVWLEGAFFLSIGILTSSWTRNQIVAAISSYTILFLLYFSASFTKYFSGPAETVIQYISTLNHLENFSVGLVTTADTVYYLSGIVVCLVLTRFSIENRLWR